MLRVRPLLLFLLMRVSYPRNSGHAREVWARQGNTYTSTPVGGTYTTTPAHREVWEDLGDTYTSTYTSTPDPQHSLGHLVRKPQNRRVIRPFDTNLGLPQPYLLHDQSYHNWRQEVNSSVPAGFPSIAFPTLVPPRGLLVLSESASKHVTRRQGEGPGPLVNLLETVRDILDPANIVNHIGINIVQFLGTQALWLVLFLLSSAASTRKRRSLEEKEMLTLEEKELLLEDNDLLLKEKELLPEEKELLPEEKEQLPEEKELILKEKELLATAAFAGKELVLVTAPGKNFFRKQGLGRKGRMSSE